MNTMSTETTAQAQARRAARRSEVKAKMDRYYDLGPVLAKGDEAHARSQSK